MLSDDDDSDSSYSSQEYESAEEGFIPREKLETPALVNAWTLDTSSSHRVYTLNLDSPIAVQYFKMLYDASELGHGKRIVLAFSTDEEYDLYQVTVRGSVAKDVEQCLQHMKILLGKVLSEDGHTYTLLPLWTRENILALRGSPKLAAAQRRFGAVCRFITHHGGQKTVHVEVASSSAAGVQGLVSFIKELRPCHATWSLPAQLAPSGKIPGFDVYTEISAPSDPLLTDVLVQVWGFNKDPEQALDALLNPPAATTNSFTSVGRLSLEVPSTPPSYAPLLQPPQLRRGPPSLVEHTGVASSTSSSDHLPSCMPPSFQKTISALTTSPKDRDALAAPGPGYFPAAALTTHPLQSSEALRKLYSHKASYSFQDREAGVYYQAFERAFAQTLSHAYSVHVARMEICGDNGNAKSKTKSLHSGDSNRFNNALRVEVHANVYKDCQAAISYLKSTLCSTYLIRRIVYFPRADAVLYKKLGLAKTEQDKISKAEQERDAVKRRLHLHLSPGTEVVQNPMLAHGFVSIRIKPPMCANGVRRMSFPADASITVCGPVSTVVQQEALDRCERAIKSIPPDPYSAAEIEISSLNPLAKSITPKAAREQFVKQHGLIAIRIDETSRRSRNYSISSTIATAGSGSDSVSMDSMPSPHSFSTTGSGSGLAGVATIWAPSKKSLARVMALLEEGEREVVRMAEKKAEAQLHIHTSEGGELDDISGEITPFLPDAPVPDPALSADAPLTLSYAEQLKLCSPTQTDSHVPRIIIRWPHPSLKFAILEKMPKNSLAHLIFGYREMGVKITTPYRDKRDANNCMLVESSDGTMESKLMASRAAHAVKNYMDAVASNLRAVHVLVTKKLLRCLSENELFELKAMQGLYGVHIIIEPDAADIHECTYHFDMTAYKQKRQSSVSKCRASARQPPQLFPLFHLEKAVINTTAPSPLRNAEPMELSLHVPNRLSGKLIKLEVSCSDSSRWSEHGATALLIVLDVSAMQTLTQEEIKQLDKGALVNSDAGYSHMLLRVRPAFGWDNEEQADNLHSALLTGLLTADKLGLGSIAVIAPAFNSLLSTMTPDELKAATAATLLYFVHDETVDNIQRIVCLEDVEEEMEEEMLASASALSTQSSLSLKLPFKRTPNMLAQALISFADELKESNVDILKSFVAPQLSQKMQQAKCDAQRTEHKECDSVAEAELMPNAVQRAHSEACITYSDMTLLHEQQRSSMHKQSNSVVLKGLPNNLLNCVDALWELEHRCG